MRILVVQPLGWRLGGAENMLWTILRRLDRTRLEATVVFLQPGGFEREVAELGVSTIVIPAGRLRQPGRAGKAVRSLATTLRIHRPDLVVSWMGKAHLYAAPAATLAGMGDRLVWWQHGLPGLNWADSLLAMLPARAIGCSSEAGCAHQERLWPRRRTFVVHPGVDGPALLDDAEVRLRRSRLGIADGTVLLGIVGRLQPWKGHDLFLHALAELRRRRHPVHGLVVGGDAYGLSPGYEAHLKRLAAELGLSDHVAFTGQVPDALPLIRLMDVLINASIREPFGITILEAMAAGVPVVAFDGSGPSEIIEPGVSGILVRPGDEADLVDQLERVVADGGWRLHLGRRGRQRYLDRFTAQAMVERFQEEMEALGSRQAPVSIGQA